MEWVDLSNVECSMWDVGRSGERRVGEEGRSWGAADHLKKKNIVDRDVVEDNIVAADGDHHSNVPIAVRFLFVMQKCVRDSVVDVIQYGMELLVVEPDRQQR